ncbi:MAG: radical SAM protein [Planctomycetes bacterium RIFCSPLOWO2_12_38_17]|nr:MAG: radical SAM protein [Planctomycetes bacterium RIFCSPLOWO2_12_38_17]
MEKTNETQYIQPKRPHNYVAFFLTLACNLQCPYCINLHGAGSRYQRAKRANLTAEEWIKSANRLVLRDDLPLTFQGGEPTLHNGFYKIVNEVKKEIKMDLLTNMVFDVEEFIKNVPIWRFLREAPYAAIRVSYHPGQNDINDLIKKTLKMQEAGFRVGLYGVLIPDEEVKKHILEVQETCIKMGIDFRTKEFLGEYNGKLYGTFKYEGSVCGKQIQSCKCKPSELIVDPGGYVYKCHADLYNGRSPIAHILDGNFTEEEIDKFRDCSFYGDCNPCDVKVKTNRFQIFGHTSVEIRNVHEAAVKLKT